MSTPEIATVDGVVPVVEIGVGATRPPQPTTGRWDLAHWDNASDAHWGGQDPYWVDITCHVVSVQSHVGHDRTLDPWDTGTATIIVNNSDGWADITLDPLNPNNLAMRPGRAIRWGILDLTTGVTTYRFSGFIDIETAGYAGQLAEADNVAFECVDALGEVGRVRIGRADPPVGAGDTVTQRINRLLDIIVWRPEWRDIAPSGVGLIATALDGQAIDLLNGAADSAGGGIFGDYLGHVVFRNRDWQTWVPGTPPDLTVGNTAAATVCPSAVEVTFPRAGTTTRALVNWVDATTAPIQVDDTNAQLLYGVETQPEKLDLQTSDTVQLTAIANRLLATRGVQTMPRVGTLNFDAGRDRATMLACLAADPLRPSRWRLVLERAGRSLLDRTLFVTAVDHTWDAHGWQCRVTMDDAMPWAIGGGRWDQAAWDRNTWAA